MDKSTNSERTEPGGSTATAHPSTKPLPQRQPTSNIEGLPRSGTNPSRSPAPTWACTSSQGTRCQHLHPLSPVNKLLVQCHGAACTTSNPASQKTLGMNWQTVQVRATTSTRATRTPWVAIWVPNQRDKWRGHPLWASPTLHTIPRYNSLPRQNTRVAWVDPWAADLAYLPPNPSRRWHCLMPFNFTREQLRISVLQSQKS